MLRIQGQGGIPVDDLVRTTSDLSSISLDLSRKEIKLLPENFPPCQRLQCLYLERNELSSLPKQLFLNCPNLRWLDVRHNKISQLSPEVKNLKYLQTLLLEGNQITSLPTQLGELHKLTGLSLLGNPLQFPPKHIQKRGTKIVLQYLRGTLNEGYISDDESSEEEIDKNTDTPEQKPFTDKSHHGTTFHGLLMKQAMLHPSPDNPKPSDLYQSLLKMNIADNENNRKARDKKRDGKPNKREIEEISQKIQKQKSDEYLQEWRMEMRKSQREAQLFPELAAPVSVRASETAPYATEQLNHTMTNVSNSSTKLMKKGSENTPTHNQHDVQTQNSVEEGQGWVQQIAQQMLATRQQVGLQGPPSQELMDAEKRLTEAIVVRRQFEAQRAHQYRLRAFTGDNLYN